MKLEELATITLGVRTTKEHLDPSAGDAYRVVQIRHLQDGAIAATKELKQVYIGAETEPERFALKRGDILVAMLGENPKVVAVDGALRRTLADKDLAIVRPSDERAGKRILEHLASDAGQVLLRALRGGATIPHMKVGDLKGIDVP